MVQLPLHINILSAPPSSFPYSHFRITAHTTRLHRYNATRYPTIFAYCAGAAFCAFLCMFCRASCVLTPAHLGSLAKHLLPPIFPFLFIPRTHNQHVLKTCISLACILNKSYLSPQRCFFLYTFLFRNKRKKADLILTH